jgi:hypothetical protein
MVQKKVLGATGEPGAGCGILAGRRNEMLHGQSTSELIAENAKLKKALEGLICWIGVPPEGPSWATPEAKARNKAMFDAAMQAACDCFPEDYNGISELTKTN